MLVMYVFGLVLFGMSVGFYTASAPIGFMIIGGGLVIAAVTVGTISYLSGDDKNGTTNAG